MVPERRLDLSALRGKKPRKQKEANDRESPEKLVGSENKKTAFGI